MINDLLTKLLSTPINPKQIEMVEKKFAPFTIANDEAKSLISALAERPVFAEGDTFFRVLSLSELLDADVDMNVAFSQIGIIPCIDCGDNDFISYDATNGSWCRYNIAEEFKYSSKPTILDYYK